MLIIFMFMFCMLGYTWVADTEAKLVYSAFHQGSWNIYIQTSLASVPTPLAEIVPGDKSAPALAPDGRYVAFEVQDKGIYVCSLPPLVECRLIHLPQGSAVRPSWHPTTGDLLFVRYLTTLTYEDSDIFIERRLPTAIDPLITQTGIQDYPNISPDGRLCAYSSGSTVSLHRGAVQVSQQIWVMNLETGTAKQVTLSKSQDTQPRWSPSGKKLTFASDRTGQFEIWVINSDGNDLQQVTSGLGAKTWPTWSPDGKSIMFTLMQDGHQRLWIIDADGLNLRHFEPFGPGVDVELRDAHWR